MEPGGGSLLVMRSEQTAVRLFRVALNGGAEVEIKVDRSLTLGGFGPTSDAISKDGRIAISLLPSDTWFNPPAILEAGTGKITRIAADPARDYHYPIWTADGQHMLVLSMGLRATLWKFAPEK